MAPHILCMRVDLRLKFHPFVLTLLYWGQKRVINFLQLLFIVNFLRSQYILYTIV